MGYIIYMGNKSLLFLYCYDVDLLGYLDIVSSRSYLFL